MKNRTVNKVGILIVGAMGIVSILASQTNGTQQSRDDPEFVSFEPNNNAFCLDTVTNFVRVNFEVDPRDSNAFANGRDICTRILANGVRAHTLPFIHCYDDDGSSGEFTFSITDVLGTNVPSEVTITGELVLSPSVGVDPYDIENRVIEARICNVGDAPTIPSP